MNYKLSRPIRLKAVVYAFVLGGIEAAIYFTPGIGNLINWMPFALLVMIPIGLAWLLADVGTEDRSPAKFFKSFVKYHIQKLKGYSVYRGRKIEKPRTYRFGSFMTYTPSIETNLVIENNVETDTSYIDRIQKLSETNKGISPNVASNSKQKESDLIFKEYVSMFKQSEHKKNDENVSFNDFGKQLFGSNDKEDNQQSEHRAKENPIVTEENKFLNKKEEVNSNKNKIPFEIDFKEEVKNDTVREEKINKKKVKDKKKKPKKTNKKSKKKILYSVASFFMIALGSLVIFNISGIQGESKKQDNNDYQLVDDGQEHEENLISGLRSASLQEYEEAVKYFEKVDFNLLTQEEKEAMLLSYLFTDRADKALELEQQFDIVVASYYVAKKDIDSLRQLNDEILFESPVFEFEIAFDDKEHKKVIKLKEEFNQNKDQQVRVVSSFLALGKYEEALEYAEDVNNQDLINKLKKKQKKSREDKI